MNESTKVSIERMVNDAKDLKKFVHQVNGQLKKYGSFFLATTAVTVANYFLKDSLSEGVTLFDIIQIPLLSGTVATGMATLTQLGFRLYASHNYHQMNEKIVQKLTKAKQRTLDTIDFEE